MTVTAGGLPIECVTERHALAQLLGRTGEAKSSSGSIVILTVLYRGFPVSSRQRATGQPFCARHRAAIIDFDFCEISFLQICNLCSASQSQRPMSGVILASSNALLLTVFL